MIPKKGNYYYVKDYSGDGIASYVGAFLTCPDERILYLMASKKYAIGELYFYETAIIREIPEDMLIIEQLKLQKRKQRSCYV